jgi:hypothetical protein
MTVVDLLRKSIAETEASLAAQYAALAELEAGPNAAQSPRPASLIGRDLKSVKQAAAMFSFTERTIRKLAPALGAQHRLGGRIYVDVSVLAEQLAGKTFPLSSTARPEKICDSPFKTTGGKEQTR